jgi:hypothetical protein
MKSYNIGQHISIDESLVLYRGHHSYQRYIPNKAARFGFKLYCLADSKSGYCSRFLFDEGSKTRLAENCPGSLSKPGKVCWTLLSEEKKTEITYLNQGRTLAVDNFYTCIYLFFELSKFRTESIGTVRSNRAGLPVSVLKKNWKPSEKGNRIIKYCYRFKLMNWMDSKPVRILCSIGSGNIDFDGKPEIVRLYNSYMPDKNDQMKSGRKLHRPKVRRYYKVLFII